MLETQIEAILASPPDRDELIVQLFAKDGGQWAEIYRETNEYWIDLYIAGSVPLRFKLDGIIKTLEHFGMLLRQRLDE